MVTHKEPLSAGGYVFPVSGGGLPSVCVRVDLYSKNCIQSVDPLGGKIGQNQQIDRKNLCMLLIYFFFCAKKYNYFHDSGKNLTILPLHSI